MKHAFGYGETLLSGNSDTVSGSWYGLKVLNEATFSTLRMTDGIDLDGETLSANTELESNIATASISSGIVILYYGKEDNVRETNLNYKGNTP